MKKVLFAVAAIAVIGISSCTKDCVDCSSNGGGKICKADYEATGASKTVSWSTYVAAAKQSGCK